MQRTKTEPSHQRSGSYRLQLPHYTADELAQKSIAELTAIYKAGRAPESLRVLDGAPPGRMLTSVGPLGRGPLLATIARLAKSGRFPWAGKTFSAVNDQTGAGVNRVRLGKTREWFPFDTSFEASAIDGEPCVFLDYDKPENPFFIRAIRDELREVSADLYLGPAMANIPRLGPEPKLMLYFVIDKQSYRR